MEFKDIALFLGIALTFLLGISNLIITLYLNRRTTFINTVTSERVKWIGKLRENISNYVGLTHYWFVSHRDIDPQKLEDILQDLRIFRYHITLQLNPNPDAIIDQKITRLVKEIPDIASKPDATALLTSLDELISEGQQLLKAEWDKVKLEAQIGALADTSKAKRERSKHLNALGLLLCMIGIILISIWGLPHLLGTPQLQAIPKDELIKLEIKGNFDGKGYYKFDIYNGSDWILKRLKLSIGLKDGNGQKLWERIYEKTTDIQPLSTDSCNIKLIDYAPKTNEIIIEVSDEVFNKVKESTSSEMKSKIRIPEVRLEGALGYKVE